MKYARNVFAQRTCSTAATTTTALPILSMDVLAMLPDVESNEISLHQGDGCSSDLAYHETYQNVWQKWTVINTSWDSGSTLLMQRTVLL